MMRNREMKIVTLAVLFTAVSAAAAFADTSIGATTFFNSRAGKMAHSMGIPQLIKMPFKIFVKAGEALPNSSSSYVSSEDVAVGGVYDQSAETTG